MKLHRNIFQETEDNLDFLLYLYKHSKFTITEVCNKFEISYQALFNHLTEWESRGYVLKEKQPPKLGGLKFKYSLSNAAKRRIKEISQTLTSKLND